MLQVVNISKSYGSEVILEGVSFVVNPGERAGLIGPNGSGKSTLLRIVAGEEQADSGQCHPQLRRVRCLAAAGVRGRSCPYAGRGGASRTRRPHQGASDDCSGSRRACPGPPGLSLDALLEEYGRASDEFVALGGYDVEQRTAEVLQGLDLGEVASDTPLSILSGGQRTRAGLASIIVSAPDVLLLDEPTNHLDIQALEWLEEYLSGYDGCGVDRVARSSLSGRGRDRDSGA